MFTRNVYSPCALLLPLLTRMHSSRMRTSRTLTVFWRPPPEKLEPHYPPPKIGDPPGARPDSPPPVDRYTHACENITLAKTSFRPVNMFYCHQTKNLFTLSNSGSENKKKSENKRKRSKNKRHTSKKIFAFVFAFIWSEHSFTDRFMVCQLFQSSPLAQC